eukprot:g4459.t1
MADVITGEPQPELARLYGAWAKGGAGLIITGNVMVDDHLEGPGNVVARGVEPSETWKAWAKASKMCRENSSDQPVAIVQLSHPGRQSPPSVTWARPVAPSAVPFHLPGVGVQLFRRPRPLATAELQQLPERFAAAARLAVAAGFDGVQSLGRVGRVGMGGGSWGIRPLGMELMLGGRIHSAHGYLLSQFLSPHTNRRDDAYGGSAAKRRRLLLEILAAVRLAIGTRCMLSVKVNCADFRVGGLDQADALELMTELQKATVDLVEISGGTYETMAMMTPGTLGTPHLKPNDEEGSEGYFVDFSRRVRNEVRGLPVMAVGGFKSLSGSAKAIIDGDCDVVGLCGETDTENGRNEVHEQLVLLRGPPQLLGTITTLWLWALLHCETMTWQRLVASLPGYLFGTYLALGFEWKHRREQSWTWEEWLQRNHLLTVIITMAIPLFLWLMGLPFIDVPWYLVVVQAISAILETFGLRRFAMAADTNRKEEEALGGVAGLAGLFVASIGALAIFTFTWQLALFALPGCLWVMFFGYNIVSSDRREAWAVAAVMAWEWILQEAVDAVEEGKATLSDEFTAALLRLQAQYQENLKTVQWSRAKEQVKPLIAEGEEAVERAFHEFSVLNWISMQNLPEGGEETVTVYRALLLVVLEDARAMDGLVTLSKLWKHQSLRIRHERESESDPVIGVPGCRALARGIGQMQQHLTNLELDLSGNQIGNDGCTALAHGVSKLQCITNLNLHLSENKIGKDGFQALADAISKLQITGLFLNVSENGIGDAGCTALAHGVSKLQCITNLNLSLGNNQIGKDGCTALAHGVSKLQYITNLNLSLGYNQIGKDGCTALAHGVSKLQCITNLNLGLGDNQIGKDGCTALAKGLCQLQQVTKILLWLWGNEDQGEAAKLKSRLEAHFPSAEISVWM